MSPKAIIKAASQRLSDAGWLNSNVTVHGGIITVRGIGPDGVERSAAGSNLDSLTAELIALAAPQEQG